MNFACLSHDIGKIVISDKILNKTSSLTEDESFLSNSYLLYIKHVT
ncbi:HD domain-containing protein [Bacillus cereus]|nr:HD domain-containing protein [Bacillus cereus]